MPDHGILTIFDALSRRGFFLLHHYNLPHMARRKRPEQHRPDPATVSVEEDNEGALSPLHPNIDEHVAALVDALRDVPEGGWS